MPDLTLAFVNPRLVDDCSFHPSVRFNKWETDKVLSFVPPDGHFRLMSYRYVGIDQHQDFYQEKELTFLWSIEYFTF
jgi:hypothetical protein